MNLVHEKVEESSLASIDQIHELFPQWKRSSVLKKIQDTCNNKDLRFVSKADSEIIAHVKYEKGQGIHNHVVQVTSLIVSKEHRRKGIAYDLMQYSIKQLPNNVKIIKLAVDSKNKPAIKLYKKLGFKKYGLLKNASLINGKLVDNYLMAKYI